MNSSLNNFSAVSQKYSYIHETVTIKAEFYMTKKSVFFLFLIFLPLTLLAVDYSDELKYGNKTSNLAKIARDIDSLKQSGIPVKVPKFYGIGHDEVMAFLSHNKFSDKLNDYWEDFKKAQHDSEDLTNAGKAALTNIRELLEKALTVNNFSIINNDDRQAELQAFIAEIAADKSNKLMVRSTGREDTKEMANAGGNESIANVQPNNRAISEAMLRVLQSYFSEKSFQQRIAAGEEKSSLFQNPFMPVLLQIMIGEKENRTPVSGVAFSREPFANTKNITAINATFGHGEAVVNGIYPVDSFYITANNLIYPILRYKHTRLKPKVADTGLEAAKNTSMQKTTSSLGKETILHIKNIAQALEKSRNESVDIEFTTLDGQIYILQVRPIVEAKSNAKYLSDQAVNSIAKDSQFAITPIVSGGGELKVVGTSDEVILAERIQKALDMYLGMPKAAREKIKLVIVGHSAPFNSHEATTFRANNKPVMYARNFEQVRNIINSGKNLVADVQRGILAVFDNLNESTDVVEGWFKHPIPGQMSLIPEFFLLSTKLDDLSPEEFKSLLPFFELSLDELLKIVRGGEVKKALFALQVLRFRITKIVTKTLNESKSTKDSGVINTRLKTLLGQFMSQSRQLESSLNNGTLERLFAYNFLEALLKQLPTDQEIILPLSIFANLSERIQGQKLAAWLDEDSPSDNWALIYAKLSRFAFTPEVEVALKNTLQKWQDVSEENNQNFAQMIRKLAQLEIVPLWLNLSFFQAYPHYRQPNELVFDLVQSFSKSASVFEKIFKYRSNIQEFSWANFQDPKKFHDTLILLKKIILGDNLGEIVAGYNNYPDIAKSAVLSTLIKLVAHFDDAIKAQSRSSDYASAIKQSADFYELLLEYQRLLPYLTNTLLNTEESSSLHEFTKLDVPEEKRYFNQVQELLKAAFEKSQISLEEAKKQMLPSREFNVAAAKLTSLANFSRSIGTSPTLEDLFSLIHQNLLTIIGYRSSRDFGTKVPLPTIVENLKEELLKQKSIVLTGLDIGLTNLILYFNETLRNHSSSYEIIYDYATKKTRLKLRFLGEARDRWPHSESVTRLLLPLSHGLKNFSDPFSDLDRGLLEIDWQIDSLEQAANAIEIIRRFANLSNFQGGHFDNASNEFIGELIGKIKPTADEIFAICQKEFWHNLNNNRREKLFFTQLCKRTKLKNLKAELSNRVTELANKGEGALAFQYIKLGTPLAAPYDFPDDYPFERGLLTILLESKAVSNWDKVSQDSNHIAFYLLEYLFPSEKIIALLEKLKPETLRDKYGHTLLHKAVAALDLNVVKYLVEKYPKLKNVTNSWGEMPFESGDSFVKRENQEQIEREIQRLVKPD